MRPEGRVPLPSQETEPEESLMVFSRWGSRPRPVGPSRRREPRAEVLEGRALLSAAGLAAAGVPRSHGRFLPPYFFQTHGITFPAPPASPPHHPPVEGLHDGS